MVPCFVVPCYKFYSTEFRIDTLSLRSRNSKISFIVPNIKGKATSIAPLFTKQYFLMQIMHANLISERV